MQTYKFAGYFLFVGIIAFFLSNCGYKIIYQCDSGNKPDAEICEKTGNAGCPKDNYPCGTTCCPYGDRCQALTIPGTDKIDYCCIPYNYGLCGNNCANKYNLLTQECKENKIVCKSCSICEESPQGYCNPGLACTHDKNYPCCALDTDPTQVCGNKCCPYGHKCNKNFNVCICEGCSLCPDVQANKAEVCDPDSVCGTKSHKCMKRGEEDCGNDIICPAYHTCALSRQGTFPCCPDATPVPCGKICCKLSAVCEMFNGEGICVEAGEAFCPLDNTQYTVCKPGQICQKALSPVRCLDASTKICPNNNTCRYDEVCAPAPQNCCPVIKPKYCSNLNQCCYKSYECGNWDCVPPGFSECKSLDLKQTELCKPTQECCNFLEKVLCVPLGTKASCFPAYNPATQKFDKACYCVPGTKLASLNNIVGVTCLPEWAVLCSNSLEFYCDPNSECRVGYSGGLMTYQCCLKGSPGDQDCLKRYQSPLLKTILPQCF